MHSGEKVDTLGFGGTRWKVPFTGINNSSQLLKDDDDDDNDDDCDDNDDVDHDFDDDDDDVRERMMTSKVGLVARAGSQILLR